MPLYMYYIYYLYPDFLYKLRLCIEMKDSPNDRLQWTSRQSQGSNLDFLKGSSIINISRSTMKKYLELLFF